MKKFSIITSSFVLCLLGVMLTSLFLSNLHESNSQDNPYVLTFNSEDQSTEDVFTKKINSGDYDIYFSQQISTTIAEGCFRSLNNNDYISLIDSPFEGGNKGIKGLISLSVTFSGGSSNSLKVSYGWSNNKFVYSDGALSDSSLTYNFNGHQPSYFKIENITEQIVNIEELIVTYSCNETTPPLTFTHLEGGGYSVKASTSSSLTNVIIPSEYENEAVISIEEDGFYRCTSLKSIVIPNSVTSIGNDAFSRCTSLTSIDIPNSVTSIGDYAFAYCTSLDSIVVDSNNSIYDSRDNCNAIIETSTNKLIVGSKNTIIPNSVTSIGNEAFRGWSSLTSINIPNSVTSIGIEAFRGCSSLTSINIPNSVTFIGGGAFYGCSSLTSISIPNSLTSIDISSFNSCSSLTSISIPNSVTSIGNLAFYGCSSLTSISIPNSVTSIGESAFTDCSSIDSIVVDSANPNYDSRDNCNAIIETSTNKLIVGSKNTIIPKSVTYIGKGAFKECSSLTTISIPNSVTSIGNDAFRGCSSLTSITYLATKNEWGNVDKGTDWHYRCPASVVHCSDGDIAI